MLDVVVHIIHFGTVTAYITNQSTHSPGNPSEIMSKVGKWTEPTSHF